VKLLLGPLPVYDFMTYWAAGRLFLTHGNPYSASAIYAIERALGWNYQEPLVLLNPPWALPIVSWFALLPYHAARAVWLGASLLLESVSAVALWRYFGGDRRRQWMALALVVTFLPAGAAERMGQITPLMLFGLTVFLVAFQRHRYVLAGVALLPLGIKPHLVYLVLLAVILWAIQNRKVALAVSAIFTTAASTAAAILYNPNLLGYSHDSTQAALNTSCGVGGVLRSLFGLQHTWLQFLPTVAGVAWFAVYWSKHRGAWIWEERLPLLLLVSLATTPYVWAHDYVLALPAFVALTAALARTRTDWLLPAASYLVVQILIFTEAEPLSKAWMATASLLWLALYQLGVSTLTPSRASIPATAALVSASL
jgi:hypothetical protein